MKSDATPDVITRIDNGLGTSTLIGYAAAATDTDSTHQPTDQTPTTDCRIPVGAASYPVQTSITTETPASGTGNTGNSPSPADVGADASTMTYSCPRYATARGELLGWTEDYVTHLPAAFNLRPGSVEHTSRLINDAGISQTVLDEITDTTGHRLRIITSQYAPMPTAPYRNLLTATRTGDCDPASGYCAATTQQISSYDADGNNTAETDTAAGSGRTRTTTTSYLVEDGPWLRHLPRLTEITDPTNPAFLRRTLTCYDSDTSTHCDTPPTGGTTSPRGLPTLTRAWNGTDYQKLTTSSYDRWGNKITTADGAGNTTTTTYDPTLHLYPIAECNALNQCTNSPEPWDRRAEAPMSTTDPNGARTNYSYDALGRPATKLGPTGVLTTTSYSTGPAGTITTTTLSSPDANLTSRTYTNGLGHTYRTEKPGGDGSRTSVRTTTYLDASLPFMSTGAHFSDDPVTTTDTISYDALGRAVRVIHADGTLATTSYLVDATGVDRGQHHRRGLRTATCYSDGWGQFTRVDRPSLEHPGALTATRYRYDAVGDQTSAIDAHDNIDTNDYNDLGQKTAEHDPDRGTTSYSYDTAGNLAFTTDARNRTLTYHYDPLNRRTSPPTSPPTPPTPGPTTSQGTAPASVSSPPPQTPPQPAAQHKLHAASPTTCSVKPPQTPALTTA